MFLPWAGLFDSFRLCDTLIHYDDVQMPQGRSLMNRVQVKVNGSVHWLTAPVARGGDRRLQEIRFDETQPWREKHLATLRHAFSQYPSGADALGLAEAHYAGHPPGGTLADFNIGFIERVMPALGIATPTLRSSQLGIGGSSTQRLIDLVSSVGGSTYITGHGAARYLDHAEFERAGIEVRYMHYEVAPYAQKGEFTPFVTVLDLIASIGAGAPVHLRSDTVSWREFLSERESSLGS